MRNYCAAINKSKLIFLISEDDDDDDGDDDNAWLKYQQLRSSACGRSTVSCLRLFWSEMISISGYSLLSQPRASSSYSILNLATDIKPWWTLDCDPILLMLLAIMDSFLFVIENIFKINLYQDLFPITNKNKKSILAEKFFPQDINLKAPTKAEGEFCSNSNIPGFYSLSKNNPLSCLKRSKWLPNWFDRKLRLPHFKPTRPSLRLNVAKCCKTCYEEHSLRGMTSRCSLCPLSFPPSWRKLSKWMFSGSHILKIELKISH